jgi:hypothetical protein
MWHQKIEDQFQLKRYYIYVIQFYFLPDFPYQNQLLNVIFLIEFQNILKQSDSNILSLLSCRSLMDHKESMKAVTNFAKRSIILIFYNAALNLLSSELFCKTLCFSQQNFQPFFTHSFFMNLAVQHFIHKHTNLAHLFSDHQELGTHTDIIESQSTKISTFR